MDGSTLVRRLTPLVVVAVIAASLVGTAPPAGSAVPAASLVLAGPETAGANVPVPVKGRFQALGLGVPAQRVDLLVDGQPAGSARTGLDGSFSAEVTFPTVGRSILRAVALRGTPLEVASGALDVQVLLAPPMDAAVPVPLGRANRFLYDSADPIQKGADPAAFDEDRVAVIRGRVLHRSGEPLAGVRVEVKDAPEYGYTLTREDGEWDLAVNGGARLVVEFSASGHLPAQRGIDTVWNDYAIAGDVVLVRLDAAVTQVAAGAAHTQTARGSRQSDQDGARQATLLFPPATSADMVLPDGSTRPLTSLAVRATEYTVGDAGPQSMPGELPRASGYTYAVDYTVDEALAAGADQVRFSKPVATYVDNFLGFPVGTTVPAGSYDREAAAWQPEENGRVIKILSVAGGQAAVDTDGDGNADEGLGLPSHERAELARLYPAGTELWRVPVTHFTPWDYNWPYSCEEDCEPPPPDPPKEEEPEDDPCKQEGSIIECENQVLGEEVAIVGTPLRLAYRTNRQPGWTAGRTLDIVVSGDRIPAGLQSITLEVSIAGRRTTLGFPPVVGQRHRFVWDGKDAYGRAVTGAHPVLVRRTNVYRAVYRDPAGFERSFGRAVGTPIRADRSRMQIQASRSWASTLGIPAASGLGLGGWMIDKAHVFDPGAGRLYRGDGGMQSASALPAVLRRIAAGTHAPEQQDSFPWDAAALPDGSTLVADENRVFHVAPDGTATTLAGGGSPPDRYGDGGPATAAELYPTGVAAGPDGNVYVADRFERVRRVALDGTITTFAGGGSPQNGNGDGGPAIAADVAPVDLAVGPDGSVYIAESGGRVRVVAPNGRISTFAGGGDPADGVGDGGAPTAARLEETWGVAVAADGTVYIADASANRIRRVRSNRIETIAGNGEQGFAGDGGAATSARLNGPLGVAVAADGSVLVADSFNDRIRRVAGGTITTVAGGGSPPDGIGDDGPATGAALVIPFGVDAAPSGRFVIADTLNARVRRVDAAGRISTIYGGGSGSSPQTSDLNSPATIAAAPDGGIYVSDAARHRVLRIAPDGAITTVAGTGAAGFDGDNGPAVAARLQGPSGLGVAPDGSIFIADSGNNRIRRVDRAGRITTVAGGGAPSSSRGDGGPATSAYIASPLDVAVSAEGSLLIAQSDRVREVDPTGRIRTMAGGAFPADFVGDGGQATAAMLLGVQSVAVAPDGAVLISDQLAHRIRRVAPEGSISTIAGTGDEGFDGDGGPADAALIGGPAGLAVRRDGTVVFADQNNHRLRSVTPDGRISTVAGDGRSGSGGEGGAATAAQLTMPTDVAVMPDGSLAAVDLGSRRVVGVGSALRAGGGSSIVPSPDGTEVYELDHAGRHIRTRHGLTGGTLATLDYDEAGRLASVADEAGNLTTIERALDGTPLAVVGPYGDRSVIETDTDGNLSSITDPAGNRASFEYTGGGLLSSMTGPRGGRTSFDYDADGRLTSDAGPDGRHTTLRRVTGPEGDLVEVTSALGATRRYRASSTAREFTDPLGGTQRTERRPDGSQRSTLPDGMVAETSLTSDPRFGLAAPIVTAVQRTPSGRQVRFESRRSAEIDPGAAPLDASSLTDTVSVNGRIYSSTFVRNTMKIENVSPEGRRTVVTLASNGNVLARQDDAALDPFAYTYDERGRLSSLTWGDSRVSFDYDGQGRLAGRIGPDGGRTAYTYDAAGHLTGIATPSGAVYGLAHDADGNMTSLVMPEGQAHTFEYTAAGLPAAYNAPDGTRTTTVYDGGGRAAREETVGGRAVQTLYDAGDRPVEVTFPEARVTTAYAGPTQRVATARRVPADGQPTQTVSHTFDGSLILSRAWSGPANGTFTYTYDGDLQISSVKLDSGQPVALQRDRDGRIVGEGAFTFTRGGPEGAVTRIEGRGMVVDMVYDRRGLVTRRTHTAGGREVYRADYAYDAAARITQKTETIDGQTTSTAYTYDADGRLASVTVNGQTASTFAYDRNGNRTGPESATYDGRDRLTSRGGTAYTSDVEGNVISRGTDSFSYSARGELLSSNVGGQLVRYHHDHLGRLVARTDTAGTESYLYGSLDHPMRPTAIRSAGGQLTTLHYTPEGLLFAIERGGVHYSVVTDQVGTPVLVVDGAGAITKRLQHDAHGVVVSDSNASFRFPIGFAGGITDGAAGLVRFGFRAYEPASGRFMSPDPLGFRPEIGEANLYAYSRGDPVNARDEEGLQDNGGNRGAQKLQKALDDRQTAKDAESWSSKAKKCWDKGVKACLQSEVEKKTGPGKNIKEYGETLKTSKEGAKGAKEQGTSVKKTWQQCADSLGGY